MARAGEIASGKPCGVPLVFRMRSRRTATKSERRRVSRRFHDFQRGIWAGLVPSDAAFRDALPAVSEKPPKLMDIAQIVAAAIRE